MTRGWAVGTVGLTVACALSLAACGGGGTPTVGSPVAGSAGLSSHTMTTDRSAATGPFAGEVPVTTTLLALDGSTPYSSDLGGPSVGTEPGVLFGATEVLPIVARSGPDVEVLIPGPPNGLTAWVARTAGTEETDPWAVAVSITARTISIYRSGVLVGASPVAVGAAGTPTPVPPGGETFIDGDIGAAGSFEAPVLRPLGLHVEGSEAAVDDASLGATQVGIHGWNDEQGNPAVFGQAVSHACIRVPAMFLTDDVAQLPNGTPVFIRSTGSKSGA
jgi:hypothetical protein